MKLSAVRKAERLAKEWNPQPRTHYVWWDLDETRDMVHARIRARVASGKAGPNDRFVIFTWLRDQGVTA